MQEKKPNDENVTSATPLESEPLTPTYTQRVYTSDSEDHYRALTTLFKDMLATAQTVITVTALVMGAVIALGLAFSYKSLADVKTEVKQSVDSIKTDTKQSVDGIRADAKMAIDSTTSGAQSAFDSAKQAIDKTQTGTEAQISQIRDRAGSIALSEAQRKVDAAFQGDNIQTMVERAAKAQVAPAIERELNVAVDRAIDSVQIDIEWMAKILDASSYMRQRSRDGMLRLAEIQKKAPTARIQQRAEFLLKAITLEYEVYAKKQLKDGGFTTFLQMLGETDDPNVVPNLTKTILSEEDLGLVASATLALRESTGQQFRMFDFETVRQWCSTHSPQCGSK
jgi:hypothetical protein